MNEFLRCKIVKNTVCAVSHDKQKSAIDCQFSKLRVNDLVFVCHGQSCIKLSLNKTKCKYDPNNSYL